MENLDMNEMMNEEENLSFLQRVLAIFTEPKRAFDSMKSSPKVLGVYILIVLMLCAPIILGFIDGSMEEQIIANMNQTGTEITSEVIQIAIIVGIVVGIIGIAVGPLLQGLIYHVAAMIQSKPGFKKTLSIVLHASIISSFGNILAFTISRVTGSSFVFSPAMFLDAASVSNLVYYIASTLNIFTIWSIFVMYTGFKSVHEMNKKEAIISSIAPTLIFTVIGFIMVGMGNS